LINSHKLSKIPIRYMEDCFFCKIGNKHIDSQVICENDDALAFLDIKPLSPGHTVVIPKTHAENILDLEDSKIGAVFGLVKRVTRVLNKSFRPDGFTIGINHGSMLGQVDHLHIHVIPRFKGDGEKSLHSLVNNPPKESLSEIRSKIIDNTN